MTDIEEQLRVQLDSLAAEQEATISVDDVVRLGRRRRGRRTWTLAVSATAAAGLVAVLGVVVLAPSGGQQVEVGGPPMGQVEPRPYPTFVDPYAEQLAQGHPVTNLKEYQPVAWKLLAVNTAGTAVVVEPAVGCGTPTTFRLALTKQYVTISVLLSAGPTALICSPAFPLRIPLPEPLGDRLLVHSPVPRVPPAIPEHKLPAKHIDAPDSVLLTAKDLGANWLLKRRGREPQLPLLSICGMPSPALGVTRRAEVGQLLSQQVEEGGQVAQQVLVYPTAEGAMAAVTGYRTQAQCHLKSGRDAYGDYTDRFQVVPTEANQLLISREQTYTSSNIQGAKEKYVVMQRGNALTIIRLVRGMPWDTVRHVAATALARLCYYEDACSS